MTRATPLLFLLLIAGAIWLSWRHCQNARALLQDWADCQRFAHPAREIQHLLAVRPAVDVAHHLEVPDDLSHLRLRRIHSIAYALAWYDWARPYGAS